MAKPARGIPVEIAGQDGGVERLCESVSTRGRRAWQGHGRDRAYHSGFMVTWWRSGRKMLVLKCELGQVLSSEVCGDKGMADG